MDNLVVIILKLLHFLLFHFSNEDDEYNSEHKSWLYIKTSHNYTEVLFPSLAWSEHQKKQNKEKTNFFLYQKLWILCKNHALY